jgi:hypothetical protein
LFGTRADVRPGGHPLARVLPVAATFFSSLFPSASSRIAMATSDLDLLCINTIRTLAMDAV